LGFALDVAFVAVFAVALAAGLAFALLALARRGLRVPGRESGSLPKIPPWSLGSSLICVYSIAIRGRVRRDCA
jgi:hypothetical protein